MKTLIPVLILIIGILVTNNLGNVSADEIDYLDLNEMNNYLFVEESEIIDISTIRFSNYYGRINLSEGTITNLSEGLSLVDNNMTINGIGILYFDFTYTSITNRVFIISKSVADLDYSLYSEDFSLLNNGEFPMNLELDNGEAEVLDNMLKLDSITETTKFFLPDMINGFSSYELTFDFNFEQVNSSSRWIALMFRGSDNSFYQVILRQGGTLANGIELSKSTNGSTSTLKMMPYDSEFVLGQNYHVKASIINNQLELFIDDISVLTYDDITDYKSGYIGFQSNGNIAHLDNIDVTFSADLINEEIHTFMSVPQLYNIDSNAVKSPSIIRYMNSMDNVNNLANIVRPHTAIFVLDDDLNVLDEDGTVMMTAYEALLSADAIVIPAFEVNSSIAAVGIGNLLKENNIIDVFVVSDNYEYILEAHMINEYIRGVLKIEYDTNKEVLAPEDLLDITFKANSSFSNVVMLPLEYANQDNNFYLHKRLLNTWVATLNSSIGDSSIAIFSGTDGVVTTNEFAIISILQGLPSNSVLSKPIIVGHRGMPSKGPENVVEVGQLAVDAGADAIELDIRLSLDDKIIVMHDATTLRTTGVSLVVETTNYDDLRALEILDPTNSFDPIFVPGLEQYFMQFQNQDNMLIIEIKDADVLIIDKLKELIELYPDIKDQIIVMSFDPNQMSKMKDVMPEYSMASLNNAIIKDNTLKSIENTLKMLVPLGAISNSNYAAATDEFQQEFGYRGIASFYWTINSPEVMYDFYLFGSTGFTTDNTYLFENTWNVFKIDNSEFEYHINSDNQVEEFTIRGSIQTPNGTVYPHNPQYEIISGSNTGIEFNNSNKLIGATSEGTVYIRTSFETSLPNGDVFTVFGDVIKITIIDDTEDSPIVCTDDQTLEDGVCIDNVVTPEPVDQPKEPSNILLYVSIGVGVTMLAVVGFIISKKAFKI